MELGLQGKTVVIRASNVSRYITGQLISISGGHYMP